MVDKYSLYFKEKIQAPEYLQSKTDCTIFLSGYNKSHRVKTIFKNVVAQKKVWLIFPEYQYNSNEYPPEDYFICEGESEDSQLRSFLKELSENLRAEKICIDITGFITPQLAYILKYLKLDGVSQITFLYGEPELYRLKEDTLFSDGSITEVRLIRGYEGVHIQDTSYDILIIGSGYDQNPIKVLSNKKPHATIYPIIGFPSFQADMYQESLLRINKSSDAIGELSKNNIYFAPANDPFATASEIHRIIKHTKENVTNIYLSPLSSKPQTLGFLLYYLNELEGSPASLLFPIAKKYDRNTSYGLKKIWKYTIEF